MEDLTVSWIHHYHSPAALSLAGSMALTMAFQRQPTEGFEQCDHPGSERKDPKPSSLDPTTFEAPSVPGGTALLDALQVSVLC